jgi:hypothetical protein
MMQDGAHQYRYCVLDAARDPRRLTTSCDKKDPRLLLAHSEKMVTVGFGLLICQSLDRFGSSRALFRISVLLSGVKTALIIKRTLSSVRYRLLHARNCLDSLFACARLQLLGGRGDMLDNDVNTLVR